MVVVALNFLSGHCQKSGVELQPLGVSSTHNLLQEGYAIAHIALHRTRVPDLPRRCRPLGEVLVIQELDGIQGGSSEQEPNLRLQVLRSGEENAQALKGAAESRQKSPKYPNTEYVWLLYYAS